MRIRHLGLRNFWSAVNEIPVDSLIADDDKPHAWTRAMALLWWWRVKSWKFRSTNLAWNAVVGGHAAGSGTFSNAFLDNDGAHEFPALLTGDEKDLLHQLNFANQDFGIGTCTGDIASVSVNLVIGDVSVFRYRNPTPIPGWITREFLVTDFSFEFALVNGDGDDVADWVLDSYEFGAGGPGDTFTLKLNLKQNFYDDIFVVYCEPHLWYPYKDHDDANPIWDEATGAQLAEPRNDSQNWP